MKIENNKIMLINYKNLLSLVFIAVVLLAFAPLSSYSQKRNYQYNSGGVIKFGRGKVSMTVRGIANVNGEVSYSLRAREGQNARIRMKSLGSHVKFDFYAVRGEMIVQDEIEFSGKLPEAQGNEYVIVVRTDARRSNFTLEITIR